MQCHGRKEFRLDWNKVFNDKIEIQQELKEDKKERKIEEEKKW